MKVAVVTSYFPSSAQPWQGRSAYQTLRLVAREVSVRVFYPNAAYPSLLKPRSRGYGKLNPSYSPPDLITTYCDYPALPLVSRPFNGQAAARVLLPHVRGFAPDLIFSCFLYPEGYAALKIGKTLSLPVVAMSIGSDINRIGDPISALHTRTVLRESDFLITVSGDLRTKAVAMGAPAEKTRTIINGCDLSIFYVRERIQTREVLHIELDTEAVVYIGRMDVKKGLRELVEAAATLHPSHPRMHVYMVGDGPDMPLIKGAIQSKDAADYIHILPGCSFDDVAVWMAAADLVTLPSYMEGCPNVILEALACGRPVVATNVGGIPEIVDDACGCLVPPRDSRALTQALADVLGRTWDANAISAHMSRSWETVAEELLAIFESVVSMRKGFRT